MNYLTDDPMIVKELNTIKKLIVNINRSSEKYLNQSIDYLSASGGKMLRPTFVLISSTFGEQKSENDENTRILATAVETLHLATLIHDDIIDESRMRRGQPTIWMKYSKEYAVYMGDYLFSQTFLMLAKQEISPMILKEISRGVAYICRGEMKQNAFRHRDDLSVRGYLDVIRGKTASLFALSLGIGSYSSGADERLYKELFKVGLSIGMAFQIIDDLLDYTGNSHQVGKDVQKDILKGYYSLPLLLALKTEAKKHIQKILDKEILEENDVSTLIELVNKSSGVDEARQIAGRYTEKAMKGISRLPQTKGKDILLNLIPKLLNRKY